MRLSFFQWILVAWVTLRLVLKAVGDSYNRARTLAGILAAREDGYIRCIESGLIPERLPDSLLWRWDWYFLYACGPAAPVDFEVRVTITGKVFYAESPREPWPPAREYGT
jgi:hypothetical protein